MGNGKYDFIKTSFNFIAPLHAKATQKAADNKVSLVKVVTVLLGMYVRDEININYEALRNSKMGRK